ncbi:MAG: zf-HC2 domain-containing protein, partial [Planctomycetota bacterium]
MKKKRACAEIVERIDLYCDRELPPRWRHRVEEHLRECPECTQEYEESSGVRRLLQEGLRARPPAEAALNTWEAIKPGIEEEARSWVKVPLWRRMAFQASEGLESLRQGIHYAHRMLTAKPALAWTIGTIVVAFVCARVLLTPVREGGVEVAQRTVEKIAPKITRAEKAPALLKEPSVALACEMHGRFLETQRYESPLPVFVRFGGGDAGKSKGGIVFAASFLPSGFRAQKGMEVGQAGKMVNLDLASPADKAAGFVSRKACVSDSKSLAQLRFTDGLSAYSIFESREFSWAAKPAGMRFISGEPYKGQRYLIWEKGGVGFTMIGNIAEADMLRIARSMAGNGREKSARVFDLIGSTACAGEHTEKDGDPYQEAYDLLLTGDYEKAI